MKILLLISCFIGALHAQLDVNILSLFSLTREEQGERSPDDSDLFAFVHAFALANRLTQITSNQLGEEVEILPGLRKTFECDVNYILQVQDTRSDFSRTLQDLSAIDNLNSFDMVIGPSRSSTCVPVSFVTSTFQLPVFSPTCTSPELDDTAAHRFFARTIPSDDATALTMIELLLELPKGIRKPVLDEFSGPGSAVYSQVAVLYQEDTYGSNFKDSLFENTLERGIDIEFTFVPFTPGNEDSIRTAVQSLAATNLNVILGLFFADDVRIAVDEAIKQEIYTEEQVWIFSDGILSAEEFKFGLGIGNAGEVDRKVLEAINNSFLVQASGQDDSESDLVKGFQDQAFKAEFGYDLDAIRTALESQQDTDLGIFDDVLARMEAHAQSSDLIKLTDFSLFAFDIILGIQQFLETDGNCSAIEGIKFIESLKELSYEGATGSVSFDEFQSRNRVGARFKLINARFDNENNPVDVVVGTFEDGSWDIKDNLIRFNSGKQQAPLVVDPPANVELNVIPTGLKAIIYVFGTIVLGAAFLLGFLTYKMSEKQVIRAAQPFFLFLMLAGVIISTSSIYIFPQEEDSGKKSLFKCNVPYFFISLGLTVSYGSLVFKLQRVVEVANGSAELVSKSKDSSCKSVFYLLLLIAVEVAIFSTTFTVAPLELERRVVTVDEFDQPTEVFDICSPEGSLNGEVYSLYFIFHILFYCYGFRLILKVKDLSTDFQEGKWITLSVVSQFQLYLLGIPVVVAVGIQNPGVRFLVIGLLVLFSNVILMGLIFGPKFLRVMTGDDKVTWQTSRNGKNKTEGSDLIDTGAREDGVADSYRRSLMNTMNTDEFGGL